jgi:hypothetical protein
VDGYTFGGQSTKEFTHTFAEVVVPEGQTYDAVTGTCTTVSPPVTPPTTPEVSPPTSHVKSHVKAETTTPTVVEAGLAGGAADAGASTGLALALAGLVLLVGAGGVLTVEGGGKN